MDTQPAKIPSWRGETSLRLLVLLVALDQVSKLAALSLLPYVDIVDLNAGFQFALQTNETWVGTAAVEAVKSWSASDAIAGAFRQTALALSIILVRRRRWPWWAGVVACATTYTVAPLPAYFLPVPGMSQPLHLVVYRVTGVFLVLTLWWIMPQGLARIGLTETFSRSCIRRFASSTSCTRVSL